MPRAVHTEPCSPGICGQQERLFPITGKRISHAPIIGRLSDETRPPSDTLSSVALKNVNTALYQH